ncbi:transposable element Tc3 transposase [Trichonephila clavipes]|nr:transposable element Tc3 transposase [Trichonephila clavipes]
MKSSKYGRNGNNCDEADNKNNNPTPYIKRKIARIVPAVQWIARWTSNPKAMERAPRNSPSTHRKCEVIDQEETDGMREKLELWFQQDSATCHTARATIDLLKDTFGDRLISRFGPVNWPPRSCDFTPLDYFLWGYVKSLVYADKPQTLDHLEDNIRRVIADIRPQMLEKVIENWTSRLDYIRASRDSSMPEIIFKM